MIPERIEVFRFAFTEPEDGEAIWNVTHAQALVADGRHLGCEAMDEDTMREIAARNHYDPSRLDAVDPSRPGIAAPLIYDGQIAWVLINGLHRNARALRDGRPFSAYLLTPAASRECLLFGPDRRMPWGQQQTETGAKSWS